MATQTSVMVSGEPTMVAGGFSLENMTASGSISYPVCSYQHIVFYKLD